jgi:beta-phosphoglucomutase
MQLDAVIFDFDGVIVDTERLHYEALQRVLSPLGLGITWVEYVQTYIGFDDRGVFQNRFQKDGLALTTAELSGLVKQKAVLFHHMVAAETPTPFPGVVELMHGLAGRIPLALCSGALGSDIEPVFRALNLHGLFDLLVTADDVPMSKPDPACYRLAVERLSAHHDRTLNPAACLAIEDTPAGITAAKGAGLKVLALTNSYDRAYLGLADYVRDSLVGLSLDQLRRIMA